MGFYDVDPLVYVAIPTLEDRPVSWAWVDAFYNIDFELGVTIARDRIDGIKVADARNEFVERALKHNAQYVFFISDDVLCQPDAFKRLRSHRDHIVSGVYWTKNWPTSPYLWDTPYGGPFTDWHYGDYFKLDFAGCDCLLIHTDVFRKVPAPWFSHDWSHEEGSKVGPLNTEDFYFFDKCRKYGFDLNIDTNVQCGHIDRTSKVIFGLTNDMPQVTNQWDSKYKGKIVADIGCGFDTPYFDEKAEIVRIDGNPKVRPDILCDLKSIPVQDEKFDVVHARHCLEHFNEKDVITCLKEWERILKVGGELIINVPSLECAVKNLAKYFKDKEEGTKTDFNPTYSMWQIYGAKDTYGETEYHKTGYTKETFMGLFKKYLKNMGEPFIRLVHDGVNIEVRATKTTKKEVEFLNEAAPKIEAPEEPSVDLKDVVKNGNIKQHTIACEKQATD